MLQSNAHRRSALLIKLIVILLMRSRGSLSTILAGVLVLIALLMGIGIAVEVMSMIITLEGIAANHVNTVGEAAATYSGLVTQGGALISTKGPVTIIGAVAPSGFEVINSTTYEYVSKSTEPELLLTSVGPVILDPAQTDAGNPALGANPISYYLYHWVSAVITTGQNQQNQYPGVIITLGNNYYLLHIDPNYIVGPLNGLNTYITKDYGIGQWGCINIYGGIGVNGAYTTCPAPPPGPIDTTVYNGYWPQVTINPINSTAIGISITFLNGTSFIRQPQYFTLYVLSQDSATWLNPTCNGAHLTAQCAFDMTWIQFPGLQGNTCYYVYNQYNKFFIWCTLPQPITYNIVMNMNQQVPGGYYLVMVITYPQGFPSQWFVWNITGTTQSYPTWLDAPGQPATVEVPG